MQENQTKQNLKSKRSPNYREKKEMNSHVCTTEDKRDKVTYFAFSQYRQFRCVYLFSIITTTKKNIYIKGSNKMFNTIFSLKKGYMYSTFINDTRVLNHLTQRFQFN